MDLVRALLALIVVAAVAALAIYPFFMFFDVLIQPQPRWRAVGRSKLLWALIVFFGYFVGAIVYSLTVRRELMAVAATVPPPRYPPPPPPPPPPANTR